jgi:uncharacterized coiled-coil protein SlyX
MESRVVTLEVRYTHLERQVEDLSLVVFEQQKLLDRLTQEVANLRARLLGVETGPRHEVPPHY